MKVHRYVATTLLILLLSAGHEGRGFQSFPSSRSTWTSLGPARAPVTILVFSDFESFYCARSAAVIKNLLNQNDKIRLVYKNAPLTFSSTALLAHEAAMAAGAQGKFWNMHDFLFENQKNLSRAELIQYARKLNLNVSVFQRALDNHTYLPLIQQDIAEAKALGISTTPTFFINGRRLIGPQGYDTLDAVVQSVLPSGINDQVMRQESEVDKLRQPIDLRDAPEIGPLAAPVSVVEFGDFECPFCAGVVPTISKLLSAYPTQVRFSFKQYPLPMHQESEQAHEAALAAGEQGRFWEMHDLLYASQDKLTRSDLIARAAKINLNLERFTGDLDSHRFKPIIDADRKEGDRLGVDGTPYFFVNGRAFSGALSYDEFKKVIDDALGEVKQTALTKSNSTQTTSRAAHSGRRAK